ncbi:MAG: NnrU family protein [Pseudomonadota bacterium]|nr:NnrU family protein [Pseudomonadota bacterium]
MAKLIAAAYGIFAYVLFLLVFVYFILFVGDLWVPKTVSSGEPGGLTGMAVDVLLLALFGIQHSVMARPGFKRWWTRLVPESIERSTYVLISSVLLGAIVFFWQPIEGVIWEFENNIAYGLIYGLFGLGWLIATLSTFLTDHFDLFGLRQVYLNLVKKSYTPVEFRMSFLYRMVRHPMMLGMLIGLWATPVLTAGHLLLALGLTVYIVIGIQYEERDLMRTLGEDYRTYRESTPMLLPRGPRVDKQATTRKNRPT